MPRKAHHRTLAEPLSAALIVSMSEGYPNHNGKALFSQDVKVRLREHDCNSICCHVLAQCSLTAMYKFERLLGSESFTSSRLAGRHTSLFLRKDVDATFCLLFGHSCSAKAEAPDPGFKIPLAFAAVSILGSSSASALSC